MFRTDIWLDAFLFAFPALFSIINPVGLALIFQEMERGRPVKERKWLAFRVGIYSGIVLLTSLWLGGYVLNFFGISLSALRIAGGLVVTVRAWAMLLQPQSNEFEAGSAPFGRAAEDVAFFPLTMPITTGPGTMAVAVALSSQRPSVGALSFFGGITLAAVVISVVIWLCYRWSDRIERMLGRSGANVMSRIVSFLLLCIGIQIILTGILGITDRFPGHI